MLQLFVAVALASAYAECPAQQGFVLPDSWERRYRWFVGKYGCPQWLWELSVAGRQCDA